MSATPSVILDRIGVAAVMALPLMLLHARGGAEAMIAAADIAFLLRSALVRDWSWLRPDWMRLSLLWWSWLVVCSAPLPALGLGEDGLHWFAEALAILR